MTARLPGISGSDFLVRRGDDGLRIAAYLTRQDLPELLRGALDT
ncbi:hypothetical protein OG874_09260 [Nocardia sp. NBC_00565]|nr:hypothetical protein [Nocardia sp. NBC_00565]WUC05307.1 hypothetical protein OG874_09260 [Nocardia sp. NBC_00565]